MNRILGIAAVAVSAFALTAPGAHAADAETNARDQDIWDTCTFNENGQALLKQGIEIARYDVTSKEWLAFAILGFGRAEFDRSEEDQKHDVMIRAARYMSRYDDAVTLTMARTAELHHFFYDDSLICLKHAFRETTAELGARVQAEHAAKVAQDKAAAQAALQAARDAEKHKQDVVDCRRVNGNLVPNFLIDGLCH